MLLKSYFAMGEARKGKKFKFEQAVSDLEQIVERLDSGELSLEQMLKEFETGVKMVRECKKFLEQAQKKVETLISEQGELKMEELSEEPERAGEDEVD